MVFTAAVLPRIGDIARADWERCLPGEAENHDYYSACERAGPAAYKIMAVAVNDGERRVAMAPLFTLTYRLETSIQGRLRAVLDPVLKRVPNLLSFQMLGVGSPLAERCHVGFSPELMAVERQAAFAALCDALGIFAAQNRIGLVAFKDLAGADTQTLGVPLKAAGYSPVNSLPLAVLDLPQNEAAYIASLSANTRSSFRRKLKSGSKLRVEYRRSVEDLDADIMALYEETRTKSGLDYGDLETLPPHYFAAVLRHLNAGEPQEDKAAILLFWLGEELIGFNLLLFEKDKVIDKFIGRRYPISKTYHLFFVGWMENLRIALKRSARTLQSGQTHYEVKVRLGSRLEPSMLYFRHSNPVINLLLKTVSRFIAFDRMDPDLQTLAKQTSAKRGPMKQDPVKQKPVKQDPARLERS